MKTVSITATIIFAISCWIVLPMPCRTRRRPRVSLIDLHRVQIRRRTPRRWIVKDIGGLYFSSMRIGLTRRDLYRFMTGYSNKPLRDTLQEDGKFWSRCRLRACGLYYSFYHELPPAR